MLHKLRLFGAAGQRWLPYMTVAVSGGAIMIIEILGARMLTPYFGNSHFVWSAQIIVTLVALAIGYFGGGLMSNARNSLGRMHWALFCVAVYLMIVSIIFGGLSNGFTNYSVLVGSMLASLCFFFVPLLVLGAVFPIVAANSVPLSRERLGPFLGRLSATSTVGGVVGTALVAYIAIPWLASSTTLAVTACLVGILPLVYYLLLAGHGRQKASFGCGFVVLSCLTCWGARLSSSLPVGFVQVDVEHTAYGDIQVVDSMGGERYLLNDLLVQNSYDITERESTALYTYALDVLSMVHSKTHSNALVIGLGAGIVPMRYARRGIEVTVVEVNRAMVSIAEHYFDFDSSQVDFHVADGRSFIRQTPAHYDVVVLDAFVGDSAPWHLYSREAFEEIAQVLTPGGVLVINCLGRLLPGEDFLANSVWRTLETSFEFVRVYQGDPGQLFFVATNHLRKDLAPAIPNGIEVHSSFVPRVEKLLASRLYSEAGPGIVLTDNYNPSGYFDARAREALRKRLTMWLH